MHGEKVTQNMLKHKRINFKCNLETVLYTELQHEIKLEIVILNISGWAEVTVCIW